MKKKKKKNKKVYKTIKNGGIRKYRFSIFCYKRHRK